MFPNFGTSDKLYTYNPATDSWETTTMSGTRPPDRLHPAKAQMGNDIYIFGGEDSSTLVTREDLWKYNSLAEQWSQILPTGPQPPASANAAMAVLGNNGSGTNSVSSGVSGILLFGGWNGNQSEPTIYGQTWRTDEDGDGLPVGGFTEPLGWMASSWLWVLLVALAAAGGVAALALQRRTA